MEIHTRADGETVDRRAAADLLGKSAGETEKRVWKEANVSTGGLCGRWW